MPADIRVHRWQQGLSRAFGGAGGGVGAVLDDVLPVAQLYEPSDAEHHWERGEHLFSAFTSTPALAGNVNVLWVAPPPNDTDHLVVIESVRIANRGAIALNYNFCLRAQNATNLPVLRKDTRAASAFNQPCEGVLQQLEQVAILAGIVNLGSVTISPGTSDWYPIDVVLHQGGMGAVEFGVYTGSTNQELVCSVLGYSRLYDPTERR